MGFIISVYCKVIQSHLKYRDSTCKMGYWVCCTPAQIKGGSIAHTNNYLGISVTSSLGKLFSSVLSNRLYQEIESKNLLSNSQIASRKGKRTSDHLFVLKALIEDYKARKRPIYACYVDLKRHMTQCGETGYYIN